MTNKALIFLQIIFTFNSFGQENCEFEIMKDTIICESGEIELWVKGAELGKIKWEGDNITSDDTLSKIKANISHSTTYFLSNRILDSENLVKNGDFELDNQYFTSKYWPSCLENSMPQGSYCISNSTGNYWPAWINCSERKKPGIGKMFVTDAATVSDEEIWCQTVNVNQNTDYALSTWVTSVLNLNNAVLQFTINSDTLGGSFFAKPNECEWNEFFEIWNSKFNTSAKICITNKNTAGDGNDFAMDDISLNKVCYKKDSIKITLIDSIIFSINEDTSICPGDKFLLYPDTSFDDDYSFEWSTSEISEKITISEPDEYTLKITHSSGCYKSDTTNIKKLSDPISILHGDTTVCLSIKGGLTLNPGIAKLIIWSHPNGLDTSNIFKAKHPGIYEVNMYNGANCFIYDRLEIKNFCATELFIPNSFSPNGDKINDTFGAEAVETFYFHLQIINRFGKIIFETSDLNTRWSGENAPQGTYVYFLDYQQVSRDQGILTDFNKIGTVTLFR